MEKWLIKLNLDRGDYIVQNWSKVYYDGSYGYAARLTRRLYAFVDLDYNVFLIGYKKCPTRKQMRKWWIKLFENDWAYPVKMEDAAPFGEEFEPRLPFEKDDSVLCIDGGR